MSAPRFAISFHWKKTLDKSAHPGIDVTVLRNRLEEQLRQRSKDVKETADGLEFKMRTSLRARQINPGGSSMPALRRGEFTLQENGGTIVVRCRNVVLTGFFAIVVAIALGQCYFYYWHHQAELPPWTTAVPAGLLVLYFMFYGIATPLALNRIWKNCMK